VPKKLLAALLAVVVLVAAACSSTDTSNPAAEPDGADSTATLPQKPVVYEPADCPMPITDEVQVDVDCGYLSVPENRLVADSPTIKLAVMRLHSRSADPEPDPIVELGGGPGIPSLHQVAGISKSKLLDHRDLIVWDHRGIGFSTPNLDCPEVDEVIWQNFSTADADQVEGQRIDDASTVCRDRLRAEGVDLNGYTTIQNAADLADLRTALGIDEWNLHGGSYGTAMGIEMLKSHPEGVRSVSLDSVVPPDVALGGAARGESALRALSELEQACAEQASCAAKYGDLGVLIASAAKSLDDDPYRATITDPATQQPRDIAITGNDLYAGLFNAMYQPTLIAAIPGVVQAIANGDRGVIATLASQAIPFALSSTEGMTNAVNCSDRGRLADRDAMDDLLSEHPELGAMVYVNAMETQCPIWGVDEAPESFNALPAPSDIPVLVVGGRFDPVTPPEGGRRVADSLGVEFLLFPDAGHGAIGPSQCSIDIYYAFLDDPSAPPDSTCIADVATITLA
jgi:pimeloyl-ACP methyl ester carboxylesterase